MNHRITSAIIMSAFLISLICADTANAFGRRCHRRNCTPCCKPCRVDNLTCPQYLITEIAPGWYMYYSHYYEGGCGAQVQADYVIIPYHPDGDEPYLLCDEHACINVSERIVCGKRTRTKSDDWVFEGFPNPLPASHQPEWGDQVKEITPSILRLIKFKDTRLSYKARIFKLQLKNGKAFYLALEIDRNSGPSAPPFEVDKAETFKEPLSYLIEFNGAPMVLLLDTNG